MSFLISSSSVGLARPFCFVCFLGGVLVLVHSSVVALVNPRTQYLIASLLMLEQATRTFLKRFDCMQSIVSLHACFTEERSCPAAQANLSHHSPVLNARPTITPCHFYPTRRHRLLVKDLESQQACSARHCAYCPSSSWWHHGQQVRSLVFPFSPPLLCQPIS